MVKISFGWGVALMALAAVSVSAGPGGPVHRDEKAALHHVHKVHHHGKAISDVWDTIKNKTQDAATQIRNATESLVDRAGDLFDDDSGSGSESSSESGSGSEDVVYDEEEEEETDETEAKHKKHKKHHGKGLSDIWETVKNTTTDAVEHVKNKTQNLVHDAHDFFDSDGSESGSGSEDDSGSADLVEEEQTDEAKQKMHHKKGLSDVWETIKNETRDAAEHVKNGTKHLVSDAKDLFDSDDSGSGSDSSDSSSEEQAKVLHKGIQAKHHKKAAHKKVAHKKVAHNKDSHKKVEHKKVAHKAEHKKTVHKAEHKKTVHKDEHKKAAHKPEHKKVEHKKKSEPKKKDHAKVHHNTVHKVVAHKKVEHKKSQQQKPANKEEKNVKATSLSQKEHSMRPEGFALIGTVVGALVGVLVLAVVVVVGKVRSRRSTTSVLAEETVDADAPPATETEVEADADADADASPVSVEDDKMEGSV